MNNEGNNDKMSLFIYSFSHLLIYSENLFGGALSPTTVYKLDLRSLKNKGLV